MEPFKIIQKEFVPEFNLELYGNMLNKRETLHNEAVKASSELKQAIAQLNLNESEEGFRNQLLSDVENTINNNSTLGDYAASYDDMIKLSGDVVSNPALISKLKAQQDYQTFIQNIDARTDLPQHYKDYYKSQNKYYEGEYDEAGNWIKGTKWEPTKTAAVNIDKNKILEQALKFVSPNKSNSEIITYIDENGNFVTAPTPNSKLVRFNTQTTEVVELSEAEIKEAVKSVIRSNPLFGDSLRQDYNIAVHDLETKQQGLFNVDNGLGKPMSFEEFVDSIFSPEIKSASYKYVSTKIEDNKNLQKELKAIGLIGGNKISNTDRIYTKPGETSVFKDTSAITTMSNVKQGNEGVKQLIKNENIDGLSSDFIETLDLNNPQAFDQSLNNQNISDENKDKLKRLYYNVRSQNIEDLHNYNKYKELYGDTKMFAGKSTINSIINGSFPEEREMTKFEERYKRQWQKLNDVYFPEGTQSIRIYTPNKKTYDKFVELINEAGIDKYFNLSTKNGKYSIELDRSNNGKLLDLANLYNEAREIGKEGIPVKHFFNELGAQVGTGESIMQVNEDGSESNMLNIFKQYKSLAPLYDAPLSKANMNRRTDFGKVITYIPTITQLENLINFGIVPDVGNMLQPINDFVKRMNSYGEELGQGEDKVVTNISFNAATPDGIEADARIRNKDYADNSELTELLKIKSDANEAAFMEVQTAGLQNLKVRRMTHKGPELLSDKELLKLEKDLLNAKATDANSLVTAEWDWGTERYERKVKFIGEDGDPITLLIDDDHNNYLYNLNSDPTLKNMSKFYKSQVTGEDIFIGAISHENMFAVPDGVGNFKIMRENSNLVFETINPNDDPKAFAALTALPLNLQYIENAIISEDNELLNEALGLYLANACYVSNPDYRMVIDKGIENSSDADKEYVKKYREHMLSSIRASYNF